MPRMRIMTSIATPEGSYRRGDEVDLPAATAEAWVEAGMAVPVGGEEQAVAETTARRTGKTGARKRPPAKE